MLPPDERNKIEKNKIMVVDEHGFSRICSAYLEDIVGYETDVLSHAKDLPEKLKNSNLGLIVTSYPYGAFLLDEIRRTNIPTIILSDGIDTKLTGILNTLRNAYCMIKPLDYDQFKSLVKRVINGDQTLQGGRYFV